MKTHTSFVLFSLFWWLNITQIAQFSVRFEFIMYEYDLHHLDFYNENKIHMHAKSLTSFLCQTTKNALRILLQKISSLQFFFIWKWKLWRECEFFFEYRKLQFYEIICKMFVYTNTSKIISYSVSGDCYLR